MRCRPGTATVRDDPGSAVHRYALHRIRDTAYLRSCRIAPALLHLDQSDLIDQAVRGHRVAVARHAHVAHDVAAAGDRPALEFLRLWVEAHDRVRFGAGFVVPERALGEDDAVRLRLRPARRWPFLVLAGRKIEPSQIAAREIRVPDRVVGGEPETARPRC